MKKPNNGEVILSQTFYAQNLKTVSKKNKIGQLGGNLSTWDLDHLKEDFFLFPMSPYFPRNSK